MKAEVRKYAEALHLAFEQVDSKDYDVVINNLVEVLKKSNKLTLLEDIIVDLEKLFLESRGYIEAEATLGTSKIESKEILDELNKHGIDKLKLATTQDSDLIGGVILKMGDTYMDASLKNQLELLRKNLIK